MLYQAAHAEPGRTAEAMDWPRLSNGKDDRAAVSSYPVEGKTLIR